MSSEESQQYKMNPTARNIIIVICAVAIIALIAWAFKGNTTTTNTGGTEYADSSTLSCKGANIDRGSFKTYGAISTSYDISIIFHDDQLYNLTYIFSAEYSDETAAVNAEAGMHANFNISLADSGAGSNAFSGSNWSVSGTTVQVNVFANKDQITTQTADELMINLKNPGTDIASVPTTLSELKENYTQQGFLCKTTD